MMEQIRDIIKEVLADIIAENQVPTENQVPWEGRTELEKCMNKLNLWRGIASDHNQKLQAIGSVISQPIDNETKLAEIQRILEQED